MARFGRGFPTKVRFTKPSRFLKVANGSARVTGAGSIKPAGAKHATGACAISGTISTRPTTKKSVSRNAIITGTSRIPPTGTHVGRGTEAIRGTGTTFGSGTHHVSESSRISGTTSLRVTTMKTAVANARLAHHIAQVIHSTKGASGISKIKRSLFTSATGSKHVTWSSTIVGTLIDLLGRHVNGNSSIVVRPVLTASLTKSASGTSRVVETSEVSATSTRTSSSDVLHSGIGLTSRSGTHHATTGAGIISGSNAQVTNPLRTTRHALSQANLTQITGTALIAVSAKSSRLNDSMLSSSTRLEQDTTSIRSGNTNVAGIIFQSATFTMRHASGNSSVKVTIVVHPVGQIPSPRDFYVTFGHPRRRWNVGLPFTDPSVS